MEEKNLVENMCRKKSKHQKKGNFFFSKDLLLIFPKTIFFINVNKKQN